MENNNFNENALLEKENIFIPDYFNQNVQNNNKFKTWENVMLQKYGNNARLFKCTKDKIYFYVSNKDCMENPYYSSKCPICNNIICYICFRNSTSIDMELGKCCIRRRLYYLFHLEGPIKDFKYELDCGIIIYLIPFLNMIFIIGGISYIFFYNMIFFHDDKSTSYEIRISTKYCITFFLLFIINVFFAVALSICFLIYNIYFILIIWMISFPFKLIPIKYITRIFDIGLE